MLVTDIDGTLLDQRGRLPAANLAALRQCVDRDITIALATGRNLQITIPIAESIDRDLYLIVQDGCMIIHYPSMRVLSYHNLPLEVAHAACQIFSQERLSVMLFDPLPHGRSFSLRTYGSPSLGLQAYLGKKVGQYRHQSVAGAPMEMPSKIITLDNLDRIQAIQTRLTTEVPQARTLCTEAIHVQSWFLEIGSMEASKVQALKRLTGLLDQDLASVIAVGDAENDVEMIQAAGLGVAMANASDRVQAQADMVIGSHREAGLAQFIEQQMLH